MTPYAALVWRLASYDVELYGADVVAAFGEYCGHQQRILLRRPQLATSLGIVSKMVTIIMRSDFRGLALAQKVNTGELG